MIFKNFTKKISIIMPAYNEGAVIEQNVLETMRTFDNFNVQYEIVIIDDGSTDDTWAAIQRLEDKHKKIKVTRNLKNFGKGRALKKGFRLAEGDYIVFLDSDIDLHPAQLETFFYIMELDEADVVIGSKRHPNSKVNYSLYRRIVSTIYFFFVKVFFDLPINDTQTGLKLFKRKVLEDVFPRIVIRAFAFDLEILSLAHRFGYKIAEAPVIINPQRQFNRIGYKILLKTGFDTLILFFRMNVLNAYKKTDSQ